jgi:hypothetical protein
MRLHQRQEHGRQDRARERRQAWFCLSFGGVARRRSPGPAKPPCPLPRLGGSAAWWVQRPSVTLGQTAWRGD